MPIIFQDLVDRYEPEETTFSGQVDILREFRPGTALGPEGTSSPGPRIRLDGNDASISVGGSLGGHIYLYPGPPRPHTQFSNPSEASIHLDANRGDIILKNADCAEEFDISSEDAKPGDVLVINEDGKLSKCSEPDDHRVAGVISGAGNLQPAIILGRKTNTKNLRLPVAMTGTVYCNVESKSSAIVAGDLLCTSGLAGYAMKKQDREKAAGTVLGKALESLPHGSQKLIRVLVSLQ